MIWIDKLKAALVVITSSIISFLGVEYSYQHIVDIDTGTDSDFHRTMLFEAGNNFQNHDGFFKYFPNKEIRSATLYSKSNPKSIKDIVIEYDYTISTNNAGLVMQKNVFSNDRVIFVVGDSFTEGQGASPWFYDLENSYDNDKAKLVNLGILGTGPKQWQNLASSISKELQLDVIATVINIIPDDLTRKVWVFVPRVLECLNQASCDYPLGFQGYNFSAQENNDNIKRSVLNNIAKFESGDMSYSQINNIKDLIKKSRVIMDIYKYFTNKPEEKILEINESSLLALNEAASGNFYVNVVSQKNLNSTSYKENKTAVRLIEFLQKNEIRYKWCDIPTNGYHKYDPHPNTNGYKILRECTRSAIEKFVLDTK